VRGNVRHKSVPEEGKEDKSLKSGRNSYASFNRKKSENNDLLKILGNVIILDLKYCHMG